jgi:hypothetical protein
VSDTTISPTEPDAEAKRLIDAYMDETKSAKPHGHSWHGIKPGDFASGKAILKSSPETQVAVAMTLERLSFRTNVTTREERAQMAPLQDQLLKRNLPFSAADMETFATRVLEGTHGWEWLIKPLQLYRGRGGELTPKLREMVAGIIPRFRLAENAYYRKQRAALEEILGAGTETPEAEPDGGDAWSDRVLADLKAMDEDRARTWRRLFSVADRAEGGKPTKEWQASARSLRESLGETFAPTVVRWLSVVTAPPATQHTRTRIYESDLQTLPFDYAYTTYSTDRNLSILKGLAWACVGETSAEVARALAKAAEGALKKVPGVGPWGVRAAFAAVWALSEMPCPDAVPELVRLRNRVKHRSTLNAVEKAIEAVARRVGLPREELEDLSVPTYGLDADGAAREEFGDCAATLRLTPEGKVETQWCGANGKPVKAVPASAKADHADEVKEFKASADALGKMLTAQRDRLERALFPARAWTFGKWREQYLGHPLLGHLSRRLLWRVGAGESAVVVLPVGDALTDESGETVSGFPDDAPVRLFHPLDADAETVLRWRAALEARGIVQPFKQAHREIYLLTDAERNTGTYSNRFAGHVLKQHQFNSLCALRGWRNQLRLMVDDANQPPALELPDHGLRAEFWTEPLGNDYGTDTNDTGTYLYLSTDRVCFYPLDAAPNYAHASGGPYEPRPDWETVDGRPVRRPVENRAVPLADIPPLVLSEVLRDVDLFVGVASVGNDPTWADGGPDGRHRAYWEEYSFGELSATAKTRGEVLARLLPRLKIAGRTRVEGRFLHVRGDLRAYKIHLGSGNILMEPNDQYLCIVESRSADATTQPLFLPFEGDSRLSLILSKAFLLAEDTKITDPTILRQIKP